ncbi:LuxR family transcriptional regulator [Lysobacter arvi]|uniref:LuxR family transcriptional regulator n=1 Tax=Lysobacter arvi TaxID=3038776 RepID=A0ABU1CGX9_9GAMM|nr:LuxR family transcriptional regulator [Lysobacter arvi]MDR0184220.1 LuxR family transcriptional regulator [Lysobacter arvi]
MERIGRWWLATMLLGCTALATAGTSDTSPLVGRWALDVSKLEMPAEARPRSVTMEFRDAGGGKWTSRVIIVHASGEQMRAETSLPLDGRPGPIRGNYWADVSAVKMPASNVLVMQLADDGKPASTRIYSVGEDRQTMTETKAIFGEDGTPILQTNHFTRLP